MKNWAGYPEKPDHTDAVRPFFYYPLLLCLALSWWLTEKFNLGSWVYIPRLFFGLGGSAMVAYKLYLSVTSHQKKERKKTKQHISFNNHH